MLDLFFLMKIICYITNTSDKLDRLIGNLEIDPLDSFKKMDWHPPYSTSEGIKKTVKWFIKNKT